MICDEQPQPHSATFTSQTSTEKVQVCLFNVVVLIENIIPQKSSMPCVPRIYTNLIFFVIGRGVIFLPCVKKSREIKPSSTST